MVKVKKNSDDYKIALATGVFYFVYVDSLENSVPLDLKISDLRDLGLSAFEGWLEDHGGFGLDENIPEAEQELSATQTVTLKQGYCTERSKVLFAVLEMAGLNPEFVFVEIKGMK